MSDSVGPHRWQPTRLPHPWDSPGKNTGMGCHFLLQCMKVKSESEVTQLTPTFSDAMDCSPPGSSVHGIYQARVLEWDAIAFSSISTLLKVKKKNKKTKKKTMISSVQSLSRVQLFVTLWTAARQLPCPSPTPRAYSNSCPPSRWCHPAISSSVIPFSSHFQSFPALGSFQMSQLFASGGQSLEFQLQHQSFQWTPRTDLL